MSAPTDFSRIPGLTVDEASDLVCHAVVAKPREIAPWWLPSVRAWTDLQRGQAQRFMERTFRR